MEAVAKRKAGRPKGSLNKPKGVAVAASLEPIVEAAVAEEVEDEVIAEEEE